MGFENYEATYPRQDGDKWRNFILLVTENFFLPGWRHPFSILNLEQYRFIRTEVFLRSEIDNRAAKWMLIVNR